MEGEDWEKASSVPPAVLTGPPLQDQVGLLRERDLVPAVSVTGWPDHSVQGGQYIDDREGPGWEGRGQGGRGGALEMPVRAATCQFIPNSPGHTVILTPTGVASTESPRETNPNSSTQPL